MPSAETDTAGTPALPGDPGGAAVVPPAPRPRLGPIAWWLVAAIIVSDQITKALVRAWLPPFDTATVIPGFIDLIHVRNAGVAFGILNETPMNDRVKAILTTALAAGALLGIGFYARQAGRHDRIARIGLSLILGGALGNLLDRVRVGYVLDYIDVYFRGWHFWAFNVADASITCGAILVFIDLLVTPNASHSA